MLLFHLDAATHPQPRDTWTSVWLPTSAELYEMAFPSLLCNRQEDHKPQLDYAHHCPRHLKDFLLSGRKMAFQT